MIIKNNWNEITLSELERLTLLNEIKLPNELKTIEILSILTDTPTDDIMKLNASDMLKLTAELGFLNTDIPKTVVNPKWTHNDAEYFFVLNPKDITAAQFIDYKIILQQKDIDKRIARLIASFTIPKGCTYGEGYDQEYLVNIIHENMSVVEAQSLADFFTILFVAYSEVMTKSSIKKLKKQLRKVRTFKEKREIVTMIKILENVKASLKSIGV